MFDLPLSYDPNFLLSNYYMGLQKRRPQYFAQAQNRYPQQIESPYSALSQNLAAGIGGLQVAGETAIQGISDIQQAKALPTAAPTQQTDVFGRPAYNLNEFAQYATSIKPQGATGGQLVAAGLKGAAAGAAFGPIGAAVGAVGNVTATALFGARKKKIESRRKALAEQNLLSAQRQFNQMSQVFSQGTAAQNLYNNLQNDTSRFSNFYNY